MSDGTGTGAIAQALSDFQADMPVVAKNKTAKVKTKTGSDYSYTYADLADVTAAAMPVLHRHGLSFSACPRRSDHGYELVGLLLHTSGETLHGALPLHGNQPQEIGSALTYARRYLLGCMTGLVTDDDDDGAAANHAPRTEPKMTAKTKSELFALFERKGVTDPAAQLAGINAHTGGNYTSLTDLTEDHARVVMVALLQRPDAPIEPPAGGDASSEGEASGETPPAGAVSPERAAGVEPDGGEGTDPSPPEAHRGPRKASRPQIRMIFAMLGKLEVTEDERHETAGVILGKPVASFDDLSAADSKALLDALTECSTRADLDALLERKAGS